MAIVTINDENLTNIAAAIREKNGSTDTYKPADMADAIAAIQTGSVDIPEEAFLFTGDCNQRLANNAWNWFIELYGNRIRTEKLTNASYMFIGCSKLEEIPFDLNFDGVQYNQGYMFNGCSNLKKIGKIVDMRPSDMSSFFNSCKMLRELPEFVNLNLNRIQTYGYAGASNVFQNCYSLRSIPEDFVKGIYNGAATGSYYLPYGSMFYCCHTIDEIRGINPQTQTMTSNLFSNTVTSCHRVKDVIFATQEDGTPYSVNWKSQTLNFSNNVGYGGVIFQYQGGPIETSRDITGYNSGITEDKIVTDDASYQALKNDPDWFTGDANYSRYNKISAVNTINSLPDTSAYLATAGGTNTIKFLGISGTNTDGGAISTLTEEEIAVAAAKGWTVTLV